MEHIEMFKNSYSDQEYAELFAWFKERMDRLPQSLQIIDCASTDDLRMTVTSYIRLISNSKQNISNSGYTAQLLTIREALRRDHPELF